jgi:hypothetical protein
MKALAFFPLAYLAGVQGFAMFAAYALTFLLLVAVLRWSRKSRVLKLRPITVPIERPVMTLNA